ncbi:OsmC family peroxiredoxin [Nitrosomonas sp. HPC101]|uniref:OsmC family protein n=1 Tax=Nitrosomonas sp. HPC101 TaxID=1658667 RepID=UPI00136C3742|nr:OsmC family protein [Nitrosomonas sp. HPC101]MXS86059.1 OsmC family peroxiredoxin [Nitrosomonas sp. HPC101]
MTAPDTKNIVNGINIEQSFIIQKQISEDRNSEIAKPRYQTTVVWDSGYHTTANVTDGQTITGDEPPRYGGEGMGISPQDLLLTAVGHCLAASYIGGLSAARINVESLRLHVSGRVNFGVAYAVEAGNPGFEDINVVVEIQTDAPQEKVTALLEKLKTTAPIPDTIMRPVPVNIEIRHPAK